MSDLFNEPLIYMMFCWMACTPAWIQVELFDGSNRVQVPIHEAARIVRANPQPPSFTAGHVFNGAIIRQLTIEDGNAC